MGKSTYPPGGLSREPSDGLGLHVLRLAVSRSDHGALSVDLAYSDLGQAAQSPLRARSPHPGKTIQPHSSFQIPVHSSLHSKGVSHARWNLLRTTAILWGSLLLAASLIWLDFGTVSEVAIGPGGLVNLSQAVGLNHHHPRHLALFDAQLSVTTLTPLQLVIDHLNPNLEFITPLRNERTPLDNASSSNLQAVLSAGVAAYRYLGLPITNTHGLIVRDILPHSPAQGVIHLGDLITTVNGLRVSNLLNFETALTSKPHSPTVTLVLEHQQLGAPTPKRSKVRVPFNEGKLGIVIAAASLYELPNALRLQIPRALDGSEGLAEALAIIDSVRHLHLKYPLSVGLIGVVKPDGAIQPVFGIAQRVAAMRDGHLRYVLVPSVQRQSAQRASHGMIDVIGVTFLSQAVREVERLGRAMTPKEVVR